MSVIQSVKIKIINTNEILLSFIFMKNGELGY